MKNIKPLGNRLLIKRSQADATIRGILLPDSAKEKPKQGIVMAVGPGKTDEQGNKETMQVKVGDLVLFSSYAGTEVKGQDEELLILAEDDVLGILN
jgi:chaperonin GroES